MAWIAVAPCDKARIAELAQALSAAPTQWRGLSSAVHGSASGTKSGLPWVTPVVLAGPNPFWSHGAWETAVSSGALSHMQRERVARYGTAYRRVDLARNYQAQSIVASNQLSALGFDGPLTAPERASYLNTLAQVEYLQEMAET